MRPSFRRRAEQVRASERRRFALTILKRQDSQNIYMVEQLTFSQEGTVDIVASEYPCDDDERSLLAQQVVRSDLFEVYPQRSD